MDVVLWYTDVLPFPVVAGGVGVLCITAAILVVLLFRSFVDSLIMSEIPLLPHSKITKAWLDPPVRPLLRLYFFNTTNPAGFLRGQKPRLEEVGPYVYEEEWHKVDVDWSEREDRVKYKLKKTFRFRPDLSGGRTEDDRVTIPNVPLFVSQSVTRLVQSSGPPRCRGLFRGFAPPAVLCHKEPVGGFGCPSCNRASVIGPFRAWKPTILSVPNLLVGGFGCPSWFFMA